MFRTLTPIFSVLIAIAVVVFYVRPIYYEIQDLRSQTSEYVNAVDNATKYNNKLKQLIQQKEAYAQADVDRLQALVPDKIDEVKALVDLEDMIRSRGMLLGDISVTPADDNLSQKPNNSASISFDEDFLSSGITFDLIGTYPQFRSLLSDIEKSLVLMEITNISFSASEGSLQQYKLTVRLYALTPSS